MELQFKHIAPYLPHKVFCIDNTRPRQKKKVLLTGGKDSDGMRSAVFIWEEKGGIFQSDIRNCSLILRPLSDLVKEEYKKDIKFPHERFMGFDIERDNLNTIGFKTPESWMELSKWMPFYESLFCNHFDVFGLIDQGLAIDINTLK